MVQHFRKLLKNNKKTYKMENEKLTYRAAVNRMEELLAEMERPDADVETLAAKVKEVGDLLAFCRGKLLKSEEEIEKMLPKEANNEKTA